MEDLKIFEIKMQYTEKSKNVEEHPHLTKPALLQFGPSYTRGCEDLMEKSQGRVLRTIFEGRA